MQTDLIWHMFWWSFLMMDGSVKPMMQALAPERPLSDHSSSLHYRFNFFPLGARNQPGVQS